MSVEDDNNWIRIKIVDTSEGISSSDLEHIFERFVRLKRQGDGMGLGLSIAKAIAEAHGGTLTATSELSKGSVFTLSLKKPAQHSLIARHTIKQ